MSEMIERLAPLIDRKLRDLGTGFVNIDIGAAIARVVLDAMREPTDAMVNAAYSGSDFMAAAESDIRSGWKSMINEALE